MSDNPETLFLANRAVIESAIRYVCRNRLRGDHAEEFAADVRLRLVENDYAILRKYKGQSSLPTYLTTVILNMARDYLSKLWGRWRPSAVAKRAGPVGVRLEQLLIRDKAPLEQALAIVARECGPIDRAALEKLAARFPQRTRRQYDGEELLEDIAASTPDPFDLLVRDEEAARFERVKARLKELLAGLDSSVRLALTLKFEQGMKVSDIARLQRVDAKPLYRLIEDALRKMREVLEAEGITASVLREILGGEV
jgi:RNA polymerase sigma factor for flagellar operon FliA